MRSQYLTSAILTYALSALFVDLDRVITFAQYHTISTIKIE